MPFPKVDIDDRVRCAAYHEATHVFFSMLYGFGISGGIKVYDNGYGISGCRGINIFDPNAKYYHYQLEAHINIAPLIVEFIIVGIPHLIHNGDDALMELDDWPCPKYPCDEREVLDYLDEVDSDLRMGVASLMISAQKTAAERSTFDHTIDYEDTLEMLKDDFELEIEAIKKKLSEEAYIDAIVDLAEQTYVKRILSKSDVLSILKPHFDRVGIPFKTD